MPTKEVAGVIKEAKQLAVRDGIAKRSERALRLKNELNLILEMVVHAREALQNELNTEFAQKKISIDKPFLDRLKGLTACFTQLTESRIRLDKAEKEMEAEMTPAEEREAVRAFVKSLSMDESYRLIHMLWDDHKARRVADGRGIRKDTKDELPE